MAVLLDTVLVEATHRLGLVEAEKEADVQVLAAHHSISPTFLPAVLAVLADAPTRSVLTREAAAAASLLADVIRRGTPLTEEERATHPEARLWGLPPDLEASLAHAEEIASLAAPYFQTPGWFLDAGCGAGIVSAALFRATPNATGVLVDSPSSIRQVWRLLADYRMRFKLIPGDVRTAAIKQPMRLALVVNVLHTIGSEAPAMVAAVARYLEPGGTLFISGLSPQGSRGRRFALAMALLSPTPLPVPDGVDLHRWMSEADLVDATILESRVPGYIHAVARRR